MYNKKAPEFTTLREKSSLKSFLWSFILYWCSLKINCSPGTLGRFDRWLETAYSIYNLDKKKRNSICGCRQRFSRVVDWGPFTSLSAKSEQARKQSGAWVKGLREEEGPEQRAAAGLISLLRRLIHIGIWQTSNHYCLLRTWEKVSRLFFFKTVARNL